MCTLVTNMAECLTCGSVIESTHRHDYVSCTCGGLAVDGGKDYQRRAYATGIRWRDLSIFRPCNDESCPDKVMDAETVDAL